MARTMERAFHPMRDRYTYDSRICPLAEGWAQVDTGQDASYYGTWTSPAGRAIVNYCEGDVTTELCDTDAEYVAAVRECAAWHRERDYWRGIDAGLKPELTAAFERLGLGYLLH